MKSKNTLFDTVTNTSLNNIIEDIKHLNSAERQKVVELIADIDNSETADDTTPICYCLRCGKPLKSSNSIYHNMGPVCFKQYCEEHQKKTKTLF